ncbi:DUF4249 family protein [Lunatibacter salilacus]|uniref:DUF4249 family protein n=1 Tax=Lunatibacter salilacus TaxID=2483804 RepID=UPI00131A7DF9|nr:DUF4249 family protein [Lunatibacter salilacus]
MITVKKLLICLSSLLMFSCLDNIELDVKSYEAMVVVDGEINNIDEYQTVKLTISQPYFQSSSKSVIEEAEVYLFEDNVKVGGYTYAQEGVYNLDFTGVIDRAYRIEIYLPDLPDYGHLSNKVISSETEVLHPVSEITDLRYEYKAESLIFEEGYYLLIDTFDPVGKGNNYRWNVQVNGELSNDPRQIMVLEDERIDGNLIEGLDLSFDPFLEGDKIVVYQQSLSNTFYQYLFDIYMQALTQESFFDSPAFNPKTNLVSDIDVVGYFNASAYHKAEIIIGE